MSSPGWYPDPAGHEARWRWFDGSGWTGATASGETAPALPPADPGGPAPTPPSTFLPSAPWVVAIVALLLLGVMASLVHWRVPRVAYVPPEGPGATTSAPREPTRPASECPVGVSGYRNRHPADANTYGGRIVVPKSAIPYDEGPDNGTPTLASLEDVQTWFVVWESGKRRQSGVSLGELRRSPGYASPQEAARHAMACMLADPLRKGDTTAAATVRDAALTVAGRPAWQMAVDVTLNPAKQLGATGERLVVVVVDDGRTDWSSALAATVRLDRPDLVATIDALPGKVTLAD